MRVKEKKRGGCWGTSISPTNVVVRFHCCWLAYTYHGGVKGGRGGYDG